MAHRGRARTSATPDRMLAGAIAILSESGPRSVTIDRVLRDSEAPRGSVYYHFPGGREEIVSRAAQSAADLMTTYIRGLTDRHTPKECIDLFVGYWKDQLTAHEYARGCPILATTVDDQNSAGLKDVAANAFTTWQSLIADALRANGAHRSRAQSAATLAVAAIEGAVAISKATESVQPLDDIRVELHGIFDQLS